MLNSVPSTDDLSGVDLVAIRKIINPPKRLDTLALLKELIHSPDCHTVVEERFYESVIDIISDIKNQDVPGDILVAGVWKGGSSVYLHALARHFGLRKHLWLSDTFAGFVAHRIQHPKDREALRVFSEELNVSLKPPSRDDVVNLFKRCALWDGNVSFLEGPLEQTLLASPPGPLAMVHIDVDFFEPTMAALELTYERLSTGGYVIIDDYGVDMFNCRDAVDEFRREHGIDDALQVMSDYIVYWKKGEGSGRARKPGVSTEIDR